MSELEIDPLAIMVASTLVASASVIPESIRGSDEFRFVLPLDGNDGAMGVDELVDSLVELFHVWKIEFDCHPQPGEPGPYRFVDDEDDRALVLFRASRAICANGGLSGNHFRDLPGR